MKTALMLIVLAYKQQEIHTRLAEEALKGEHDAGIDSLESGSFEYHMSVALAWADLIKVIEKEVQDV